jgi:hypothetical protein
LTQLLATYTKICKKFCICKLAYDLEAKSPIFAYDLESFLPIFAYDLEIFAIFVAEIQTLRYDTA